MDGDLLFAPNLWKPTLTALQTISSLALFFVVYTIYGDKSLRKHPATIIGVICGMNAVYCFSNLSKSLICPGNAEVLYAYTVYFNTSEKSLHRAMGTMTYAWLFLLVGFFEATSILESCVLYDMVWTLKNPMKRPESRAKWYYLLTFFWSVITLITYSLCDFDVDRWPVKAIFYFTKLIYIVFFIPSILILFFHFRRGGLNQQYKKLYIRRYVLYTFLMFVCQLTTILNFANLTGLL